MALQTAQPQRNDAALRALEERLEHFIQERTNGMVRQLAVRIDDGIAEVAGLAESYYIKQLVTHAVMDADDALSLRNNVRVQGSR